MADGVHPADALPAKVIRSNCHWMPGRDHVGRAILHFSVGAMAVTATEPVDKWQLFGNFCLEHLLNKSYTQVNGICVVIDMGAVGFRQLLTFGGPADAKRGMGLWVGAFPTKLRKACILRCPSVARGLVNLCLSFVSKKIRDRIEMAVPAGTPLTYVVDGRKVTDDNEDGMGSIRGLAAAEVIPRQFAGLGGGKGGGGEEDWAKNENDWNGFVDRTWPGVAKE